LKLLHAKVKLFLTTKWYRKMNETNLDWVDWELEREQEELERRELELWEEIEEELMEESTPLRKFRIRDEER